MWREWLRRRRRRSGPARMLHVAGLTSTAELLKQCHSKRAQVWRPSLDDVQRISTGDAARHRGTGSRAVPHRLNAEERKAYDLAKQVSCACSLLFDRPPL